MSKIVSMDGTVYQKKRDIIEKSSSLPVYSSKDANSRYISLKFCFPNRESSFVLFFVYFFFLSSASATIATPPNSRTLTIGYLQVHVDAFSFDFGYHKLLRIASWIKRDSGSTYAKVMYRMLNTESKNLFI